MRADREFADREIARLQIALEGAEAWDKLHREALEAARQFILERHGICLALVQLDEVLALTPEEAREKEGK
jgi:hypothetical protein